MFLHKHPYKPFLFPEATRLIVGTLPPPRFTTGDLKEGDVDFCYGSRDGQLWRILDRIFYLNLAYETTDRAVTQRKEFLKKRRIGICDIVAMAEREKVDASDLGMKNVQLRDLVRILYDYPRIDTLIFTGGNSKNGPEYFFRRHLREYGLELVPLQTEAPRVHIVTLPLAYPHRISALRSYAQAQHRQDARIVKTVSLTAPSGSANRAIGSMKQYQFIKDKNPDYTTFDFRVEQYKPFF
ncbi:MAG: uracil-DNA glycosylase family protein [Flavobacteriaceae bacterium]